MKTINNRKAFGFWENMPYKHTTDSFEEFKEFKNTISKDFVVKHIERLEKWLASELSHDVFTGEEFNAGVYDDGEFTFPVDFLRYYKKHDIGIPPEYETYLKETHKAS